MEEGGKMLRVPIDCEQRKTGSKARAIVHYKLNAEHWDYREETGNDYGRDCVIELSENNRWNNHKIEGQIKGTCKPALLKREKCFSFPMEIKTINYALGARSAFVLFYVDVEHEVVYYLPIQDYFIANKMLFDKLDTGQEKMNVHIPTDNILSNGDFDLQEIAKSVYVDGPSRALRKYNSKV